MRTKIVGLLRRPLASYNKGWLGAVALGLTAAVVGIIVLVSALDLGRVRYQAEFAQSASLRPGDQVTVAGISVGTVDTLALAGDRVIVNFTMRNDVHLGRDTHAAIKLTTILGSRYLELSSAGPDSLTNRTIGLDNTVVPYDLQQTLADATTTFGEVDAGRIAQSLTTLSQGLTGVPDALPQALQNLQSLSAIVANRRDQLRTLLASTDTLTTMIGNQKAQLGGLIVQGRDLIGELTSRRAAVERLFASTTNLVAILNRVLGDQPGLDQLLDSMRNLAQMIASHDALLRNTLQALPIPMRNIANMTGSGTAVDVVFSSGPMIDSWMCAISGRAKQFNLVEYFKDCQ